MAIRVETLSKEHLELQNLKSEISDPKSLYLVTGGAGFSGSNIVERLVYASSSVYGDSPELTGRENIYFIGVMT